MLSNSKNALSFVGLMLLAASAIATRLYATSAVIENCNGHIALSSQADDQEQGIDRTCTVAVDSANCWTQTDNDDFSSTFSLRKVTRTAGTKLSHGVAQCVTVI